MKFEWDEDKRQINKENHGIDFADLDLVFAGLTITTEDTCEDYGEIRYITFGLLMNRVIQIVHTERGEHLRIISARKATKNETRQFIADFGQ
ncbi:MAG: BrnT family toxin [Chloroflexota bacterium]|nr:BrnT family toxin [Chloroflexota bacterium]